MLIKSQSNSIVYHKSSCVTCKRTLDEITKMKIDIQKRDFFKEPFSENELKKIIKLTGKSPFEILRKRDKAYKQLKMDTKKYTGNEVINLMVKFPGLIQRPIIIKKDKAVIGKSDLKILIDG